MTRNAWMLAAGLALSCFSATRAQVEVPKELEGWQDWVLHGQEFRRCPFLANSSGAKQENRVCVWPGRLDLEVGQAGGRFTQSWVSYAPEWIPLPGDLEHWPTTVTVNGAAAAVVVRGDTPSIRVAEGTFNITGSFAWAKRPETLAVPNATGLVSLTVDARKIDTVERTDGAVWLGKQHEANVAQQLSLQVYRLLTDGIPAMLETRLQLQAAGSTREEILPAALPAGFEPVALESELPARIDPDGRMHIQVRAGAWTATLTARATGDIASITLPAAQAPWPKQEIWSYAAIERLRVTAFEGGEAIDPAQANVPAEWRENPSFKLASGGKVQVIERGRGISSLESNHLRLDRRLYMDFSHQGYTAIDEISGQMRNRWRLDMKPPYRLMRASSGNDAYLVTEAPGGALTGVEVRNPAVNLEAVSRIGTVRGAMPATGWDERFDHVAGLLDLPPGHLLLAAAGTDNAPGAWIEQWKLLDLFLLLLTAVVAFRLSGWVYAAVAFAAVVLMHLEEHALVWLILAVLVSTALVRMVPAGWPRSAIGVARAALLAVLLVVLVPFAVSQLRFALYPQLSAPGGPAPLELKKAAALQPASAGAAQPLGGKAVNAPQAPAEIARLSGARAKELQEVVVTSQRRQLAAASSLAAASEERSEERYAPGTLLQTGPGIPQWRYLEYPFEWSGPVESTQTVHFIVLRPWLVSVWRIAGVTLLVILFLHLSGGSFDVRAVWRRWFVGGVPLALAALLLSTLPASASRASSTPDRELLGELRTRLLEPAKCLPTCAEYMSLHVELGPASIEADAQIAALSSVAVALPAIERFEPDAISVDGAAVAGVYRDANGRTWIALKPGVHALKLSGRLPASDAVTVQFPMVPRTISVSGGGWDVSGVSAGRLLGNSLQLLRRRVAAGEAAATQAASQFAPFVRVHRTFNLNLDWSVDTTVERIAPTHGGFTVAVPLLPGERVLTSGVTEDDNRVMAAFDSESEEFSWTSALPHSDAMTLTATRDQPGSEVWVFAVSPAWHAEFQGIPAVLPEDAETGEWTFEYYPRAGETLAVKIARPAAAPGDTLAIDEVDLNFNVGQRSTDAALRFAYRSTRGGRQALRLPPGARVGAVSVDGKSVPIRLERNELPLALLPGAHSVGVEWQEGRGASLLTHFSGLDLESPSSNVSAHVHLPAARWVLYAGGRGVGPAILYWGELVVFIVAALALGRVRQAPLRTHEWLLLGLGLSTFSWSVLLLFAVWIFAMRWRATLKPEALDPHGFDALQVGLVILSVVAVVSLVAAIPYGLLANPDMRIAGLGQDANELQWFNDQAPGVVPMPWVLSLSLWWYKAAMLVWALWLAFALARWLRAAWAALGTGGFWRRPVKTPPRAAATEE